MGRIALPFPVLPGKTEADIRSISERFKSDPDEYAESRRRGGVTLERVYWQQTPMKGEVGDGAAPYRRGFVLPDSFYSQRVASQKTRHSLPSRGAEKTCQSSLRLLTWR